MTEDPKTIAREGIRQSWIELTTLYVLTTIGAAFFFQMHWLMAMVVSPVIMLAMLVCVMVFVQLLWMLVLGLERVGTACGLRKSPLA